MWLYLDMKFKLTWIFNNFFYISSFFFWIKIFLIINISIEILICSIIFYNKIYLFECHTYNTKITLYDIDLSQLSIWNNGSNTIIGIIRGGYTKNSAPMRWFNPYKRIWHNLQSKILRKYICVFFLYVAQLSYFYSMWDSNSYLNFW